MLDVSSDLLVLLLLGLSDPLIPLEQLPQQLLLLLTHGAHVVGDNGDSLVVRGALVLKEVGVQVQTPPPAPVGF